jgi:hypothetical protein
MLEAKPDSSAREILVAEELKPVNSATHELVFAALSLLELIRALPQGEKRIQVAQGIGIA